MTGQMLVAIPIAPSEPAVAMELLRAGLVAA
jgi:hypothetical protein